MTVAAILSAISVYGQNAYEYQVTDSCSNFSSKALVDSSLVGINIINLLDREKADGSVVIDQSDNIANALAGQIHENASRKIWGYRVRIYFDNGKNARSQSEHIARAFAESHPGHRVYRSHVSPYFKVTVGDFRTKTEAQLFAQSISGRYPSVFLVKEAINFPD